jgi:oligoendopeptidase F
MCSRAPTQAAQAAIAAGQTERLCSKCRQMQPLEKFYVFQNHCKPCILEAQRVWRKANSARLRELKTPEAQERDTKRALQDRFTFLTQAKALLEQGELVTILPNNLDSQNPHLAKLQEECSTLQAQVAQAQAEQVQTLIASWQPTIEPLPAAKLP